MTTQLPDTDRGQRLVVVNKLDAIIEFFNADHGLLGSIKVPSNPHEILLAPDQRTAYVPIYGDGIYGNNVHPGHHIVIVDLPTMKRIGEIDLGEYQAPHGVTMDAAGYVWVCCDRSAVALAIDGEQRRLVDAVSLGTLPTPHWIVALPDGHKAYTSNKATSYLSVIDTMSRKLLDPIAVPTGTEGMALSPDGKRLYVMDHMGSGLPTAVTRQPVLYVIDTQSDTVMQVVPLEGFPALPPAEDHETRVRVSPDNAYLLVSAYKWNLVVILPVANLSFQKSISVKKGPMGIAFPAWKPGEQFAYVTNHDEGAISVIDVPTAAVVYMFACGRGPETMEFYASNVE